MCTAIWQKWYCCLVTQQKSFFSRHVLTLRLSRLKCIRPVIVSFLGLFTTASIFSASVFLEFLWLDIKNQKISRGQGLDVIRQFLLRRYGALRSMSMVSGSALNISKIKGRGNSKSVILSGDGPSKMGGSQVAFFIFGVAFHNLLEGLTLGLQNEPSAAFSLFIAILIHSGFLATAATTTLLHFWLPKNLSFYSMSLYLFLLCLVRPVGIILGLIVVQVPGLVAMIIAATLQVSTKAP